MRAFVLDNSVMMRWLFKHGSPSDLAYANHVRTHSEVLDLWAMAPPIWPMEVTNVIVRAVTRGMISRQHGKELIDIAISLPITIDSEGRANAMQAAYDLATDNQLTAYDAAYLELALRRAVPIATLDHDLIKAAKAVGVSIL